MIWIAPSEKDTNNASLDYDAFGRIYEYFLGEFAMSEGQGGGEPSGASSTTGTVARRVSASDSANQFYTPRSIVRLLTEVIEPYRWGIWASRKDEFISEGVPYISSNRMNNERVDMTHAKYLSPSRTALLRKGIAKDHDVLFAHNATVGPVAILHTDEPKVILGTSLTCYRCNQKHIPPLDEQKAVVGTLDGLFENGQRLATLYERKQAALVALKQSLLH